MTRVARAVAAVLVTATALIAAGAVEQAMAQEPGPPPSNPIGFELQSNYPNPFNAQTTIPYSLGEGLFAEGAPVVVTVRIFDVSAQLVAHPLALEHPAGQVEVRGLEYATPGQHEAFWDGTDATGAQVTPGIYVLELTVNDERLVRRMFRTGDAPQSSGAR